MIQNPANVAIHEMESLGRDTHNRASDNNSRSSRWKARDEYNKQDPKAIGINDPPACVAACRNEFIVALGQGKELSFQDVCAQLTGDHNSGLFVPLYCCDMTFCGVWVMGSPGLSPSVDLIINQCQSIGFYQVYDPGPPPIPCNSSDEDPFLAIEGLPKAPPPAGGISSTQAVASLISLPLTTTSSPPRDTVVITSATDQPIPAATITPVDVAPATEPTASPSGGLDTGTRAAVGGCIAVAGLALILALLFICRRRRRRKTSRSYPRSTSPPTHYMRTHSQAPSAFHTPLITPPPSSSSKTTPSTPPPLRLSDRRYLTSIPDPGPARPAPAAGVPGKGEIAFPQHPIFAPTSSTLLPRHESHATKPRIRSDLAHSPFPNLSNIPRGSHSSTTSGPPPSSLVGPSKSPSPINPRTASRTGPETRPISPNRPPRPHDGPLEIPGLVTPASPPPDRALPPPPPHDQPNSQTTSPGSSTPPRPPAPSNSPVSPLPQHGGIGVAIGVVRNNPAAGVVLPGSSRDLCELTEAYAREQRATPESWGSWAGGGGGGPGTMVAAGRRKGEGVVGSRDAGDGKEAGNDAVMLQDLDLERLGGGY